MHHIRRWEMLTGKRATLQGTSDTFMVRQANRPPIPWLKPSLLTLHRKCEWRLPKGCAFVGWRAACQST